MPVLCFLFYRTSLMKFLVHGSIAYDILLHYNGSFIEGIDAGNLKNLSVGYLAHRMERHHGGTAANVAWNLKLLGQQPLMVGSIGNDGGSYLALLRERGIATDHIQKINSAFTATAIIATDNSEHQITFFHPGADVHGKLPKLDDERDGLAYAIISPRDTVAMVQAAQECKRLKIPYLFDPGQQSLNFTRDELRGAVKASSGLVVNAYEWQLASEKLEWSNERVLEACGLLIITQGEHGITLQSKQETAIVPACKPDRVVNPVGAGDAVRGGLLIGLANGWSLTHIGRICNVLGSLVVAQEGTMLDTLDIDDVHARIVRVYKEDVPKW